MTQEELQAIRSLWRIDDPQHTKNTERGEAILVNRLLDEIERLTDDLHAETEKSFWQAKEIERLRGALEVLRDNMYQAFGYMEQCPECRGWLPKHFDGCELRQVLEGDE